MSLVAPSQIRSLDPYSDNRYSSSINKLSRISSGGQDVILYEETSFLATRESATELRLSAGIAIKDDVLIHVTTEYTVDMTNIDIYVDSQGGMLAEGRYYIVLEYEYARSLPAPVAYYRVIRNHTIFNNSLSSYLFLYSVEVVSDGVGGFEIQDSPTAIQTSDDTNPNAVRATPPLLNTDLIDGGVVYE